MKIKWRALPFTHVASDGTGCGREATILEICASSDGCICVSGVCEHCGEQFSSPEMPWSTIMRTCSVMDYNDSLVLEPSEPSCPAEPLNDLLEQFVPKGKPN